MAEKHPLQSTGSSSKKQTENRKPKTENRKSKIENRNPKTEKMKKIFKPASIGVALLGIFLVATMTNTPSQAQLVIANPLLDISEALVKGAADAIKAAVTKVANLTKALINSIAQAAAAGVALANNLVVTAVNLIGAILGGVIDLVNTTIASLKVLGNVIFDAVISNLLGPLLELLIGQVSAFLQLVVSLVDIVSDEVGVVLSAIENLLKQVKTFVALLVQSLGRLIVGTKIEATKAVIQVLCSTVQALEGVVKQILAILAKPNLPQVVRTALNGILSLVLDILNETLTSTNALTQSSTKAVADAVSALILALQAALKLIPDLSNN